MIQKELRAPAKNVLSEDERRLFYPATVLTPAEVAERTQSYPDKVRAVADGRWFLCGDLSQRMFDLVKADWPGDLSIRATAFASPAGVYYGVLSHQVKGLAHRFLLPLYEPRAMDLLRGIQRDPLMFMLGRDEETDAMVLPCPLSPGDFAPLLPLCSETVGDQLRDAVAELPLVIRVLKEPAQVPTAIRGQGVAHVDISVLLPSESLKKVLAEREGIAL